jgi:O-antigen ligase
MNMRRATFSDLPVLSRTLERLAVFLPALLFAYMNIVWPLVYTEPVVDATGLKPPSAEVGDFLLNKIYFPPLLLVGMAGLATHRRPIARPMLFFVLALTSLLGYFAASALWSLAPEITIRRATLEAVICVTLLCSVLSASRPFDVIAPVFWLTVATLVINLVAVLIYPAGPLGHEGIYNHKNGLGNTAGLAIIVSLYFMLRGSTATRALALAAVLVGAFLIQQSRSKTALGLAFIAPIVGLYLYFLCRICRIPLVLAIVGSAIAAMLALFAVAQTMELRLDDIFLWLFNDKTFTGRTSIWQFTMERLQDRPWFGYGYSGFWDIGPASPKFKAPDFIAKMPHAHNGYLNMALETGIIGFALLVVLLAVSLHCIGRVARTDGIVFLFFVTVAAYALLTNLMETDLIYPLSVSTLLFFLVSAVAGSQYCGDAARRAAVTPATPGDTT